MEAPIWRHIGKNKEYHKSVATVVVAAVVKAVVSGCAAAVTVPEEANKTEEGEGEAEKVRQ